MLERLECIEKDMENMRGVLTWLFVSDGEEKKRIERKMVEQERRIDEQDRIITEHADQIQALIEILRSYSSQGPVPSPNIPFASNADQFTPIVT